MYKGTEILDNGNICFRLWAPDAKNVEVHIYKDNETHKFKMQPNADKVYELTTDLAKFGDKYQFFIDNHIHVPDPYSKYQPDDVHGATEIIDPSFSWDNNDWKGLSWEDTIIYELHVGTFTEEGTYKAIISKLDYLKELGVTAIELMPIAEFPGERNWGYDGVLHFAPDSAYGTPNDLKELINAAHDKGIMVFLDIVYNHFGPDGNYLYVYAKNKFFDSKNHTPWGDAINFKEKFVRDFYVQNVLYWLKEFKFDGLRFDAVHAIKDNIDNHILKEISDAVRREFADKRNIFLMLENDDNNASYIENFNYDAQWNDDSHHAFHVAATKEIKGYYSDYSKEHTNKSIAYYLSRTIAQGYAYQGDPSYYKNGEKRGEKSSHLSPSCFINFIQNHDQVGNRAFGERITELVKSKEALKIITALYLLSPTIPMLFMGEEWASSSPFLYFCDFEEGLSNAVREGRKKEFSKFPEFTDQKLVDKIPDPTAIETFNKSKLNWFEISKPEHKEILEFYKKLLSLRKKYIQSVIKDIDANKTVISLLSDNAFKITWCLKNNKYASLNIIANLSDETIKTNKFDSKNVIFTSLDSQINSEEILPWELDIYFA